MDMQSENIPLITKGDPQRDEEIQEFTESDLLHENHKENETQNSTSTSEVHSLWEFVIGIVGFSLCGLCNAVSSTCVQLLNRTVPDLELNAFRCFIPFIITILIFLMRCKLPSVPRDAIPWIGLYVALTNVMSIVYYTSLSYIPLATFNSISLTLVFILCMILFRILLNEKITLLKSLAVLLCLFGILLVFQPAFIFKNKSDFITDHHMNRTDYTEVYNASHLDSMTNLKMDSNHENRTMGAMVTIEEDSKHENRTREDMVTIEGNSIMDVIIYGYGCCILSAVLFAVDIVISKYIDSKGIISLTEQTWNILFWSFLFGSVLSLGTSFLFEKITIPESMNEILLILGHAFSYYLSWVFYFYAIPKISGQLCTILFNSTIMILTLVAQYTVLSHIHPGHRNWEEVLGAILVLLGTILSSLIESVKST